MPERSPEHAENRRFRHGRSPGHVFNARAHQQQKQGIRPGVQPVSMKKSIA